ncbi:MAG: dihydroorotate dehydrogenase [Planctomycetota bacterium]
MSAHPLPDLSVEFCGIRLANPLVAVSGTAGWGRELEAVEGFDARDLGALILKTVTPNPRAGNAVPRLAETPAGLLNSIGLENPGLDVFVREILPGLKGFGCPILASVAGETPEEYGEAAGRVSEAGVVAAIELNLSCPNVKKGGHAFGQDVRAIEAAVASARRATRLPIVAKMTPNVADPVPFAVAALDAGADALSAINTLRGLSVDLEGRRCVLGAGGGGLSGPAVKPVALWFVHALSNVARPRGKPVLGMGGVSTGRDALEFMVAGAAAVGIGTILFRNPLSARRIRDEMAAECARLGVRAVRELTGTLVRP